MSIPLHVVNQARRYAEQVVWFQNQNRINEAWKVRQAWRIYRSQFTGDVLEEVRYTFFSTTLR